MSLALLITTSLPLLATVEGTGSATPRFDPLQFQDLEYRMIGPHRGGRVTAVAGVIQQRDTFYMGATGGGVWKTTNAGARWYNVSDGWYATPSIGAIDVADSDPNVVWVGTGTACLRSNIIAGKGVYRSTDAGATWTHVGLEDAGQIGDLVVHPTDPEVAWVAAVGDAFAPNETRGVFRTRDGGATWQRVLFVSDQVGAVDLALDPSNPRRLFAAAWRAERKPWTIWSGSEDSGLFLSSDSGDTWTRVEEGLPSGLVGRIAVDISPADPQRVYALFEAPGTARGLYRSTDGGKSFRFVNSQLSLTFRPFYYMHLTADPSDPDHVWVNNETLWLSKDGGTSFVAVDTPHGDNHALWIHPEDPRLMVQGNDGGANVSRDGGRTWSPQWNQPTAELYQVAVDEAFPYRVYGAQQDNTTISVPSRISRRPLDPKQNWLEVSGCETGPVVPHPENPHTVFGGCKGRHSVFDAASGQVRQYWVYPHFNYGHDTREMPYRFQRVAPMILSPHDPSVVYHASHVVHRSTDEGRTWETISPDLTAFDDETQGYSGGPITRDITGEEIHSALYALAESPHREGVIWAGSNDGPLHVTRDGGVTWTEITPSELGKGGRVNRIEPSPHRPGRAWVAIYRYLLGDERPYLFRADDYGESWQLLTNGDNGIAADEPVRVVREDPEREGLLYVGTESGLYVSFDAGETFQSLQLNLPVVPISGLVVHRGDLVVATMGRSFWILDDLGPLRAATPEWPTEPRLIAPREAARVRWIEDLSRQFPGYAPQYPESGAVIDYVLERPVRELELTIVDQDGETLRRFLSSAEPEHGSGGSAESSVGGTSATTLEQAASGEPLSRRAGHHRFVWDLRVEGVPGLESESGDAGVRASSRPGPMVPPGRYLVRLAVDGQLARTLEQPLEVFIDPRVASLGISEEDLVAQYELAREIEAELAALRAEVRSLRALAADLETHHEREDLVANEELLGEIAELLERVHEVEGVLVQRQEGKVGAELEPQLQSQIQYLLSMVTAADQRPGNDAYLRWQDLRLEIEQALDRAAELWGEVARVEQLLEDAGLERFSRGDD